MTDVTDELSSSVAEVAAWITALLFLNILLVLGLMELLELDFLLCCEVNE